MALLKPVVNDSYSRSVRKCGMQRISMGQPKVSRNTKILNHENFPINLFLYWQSLQTCLWCMNNLIIWDKAKKKLTLHNNLRLLFHLLTQCASNSQLWLQIALLVIGFQLYIFHVHLENMYLKKEFLFQELILSNLLVHILDHFKYKSKNLLQTLLTRSSFKQTM